MRESLTYINKILSEVDNPEYYIITLLSSTKDRKLLYFRRSHEYLHVKNMQERFLKDSILEYVSNTHIVKIHNNKTNVSKELPFEEALTIIGYPYIEIAKGYVEWSPEMQPKDPNARSDWECYIPPQPPKKELTSKEKWTKDIRDYEASGGTWD